MDDSVFPPDPIYSNEVFSEGPPRIVADQPTTSREQDSFLEGHRRPIPVSTIDWQSTVTSHFSPLSGLDFLADVSQIIIQQTVELTDLMSSVASENRYTVKIPRGETLYYATESSESCERTCFASARSFYMRLYDPTQQEALHLKRRLACGSCLPFPLYLQELQVWVPPGELVGKVCQNFNMTKPSFTVYNRHNESIYRIEGPDALFGCLLNKNYNFQIYTGDGATQVGSIIHQWDQIQVAYNLYLQLPGNEANTRHKALLIGASFLLEYMYFESSKRSSRCMCCC